MIYGSLCEFQKFYFKSANLTASFGDIGLMNDLTGLLLLSRVN